MCFTRLSQWFLHCLYNVCLRGFHNVFVCSVPQDCYNAFIRLLQGFYKVLTTLSQCVVQCFYKARSKHNARNQFKAWCQVMLTRWPSTVAILAQDTSLALASQQAFLLRRLILAAMRAQEWNGISWKTSNRRSWRWVQCGVLKQPLKSRLGVFRELPFYAKYWTLMDSVQLPLLEASASALWQGVYQSLKFASAINAAFATAGWL